MMNIFEGSRRIAKLITGLWIVGFLVGAVFGGFTIYDTQSFDFKEFFKLFVGGPFFILVFTYAMGWIVRGFMGIPQGQDQKPPK
jgi:hypothetical protein